MNFIIGITVVVLSYLAGGIMGAHYSVRGSGVDIRQEGSGNVGATNALRVSGRKAFVLAVILDITKVIGTLFIVSAMTDGNMYLIGSSFFLMIGHLFPFQLGFHGGKGVVVYLAASLFLSPLSIAGFIMLMGIGYFALRKYKVAGFIAMTSIPVTSFLTGDPIEIPLSLAGLFMVVMIMHLKPSHHVKA
ncbi:glycerol-3-phosphate acyltransferase [Rossellomorea marisflavi]|uniref:glycerol-3-phosphate acyltransferase n=1 Tax=Rossellomorea marisflavi TaxID=189381 RepID=UPI003458403A